MLYRNKKQGDSMKAQFIDLVTTVGTAFAVAWTECQGISKTQVELWMKGASNV